MTVFKAVAIGLLAAVALYVTVFFILPVMMFILFGGMIAVVVYAILKDTQKNWPHR